MSALLWQRDDLGFWDNVTGGNIHILSGTPSPPPDPDRRTLILSADGTNSSLVSPVVAGAIVGGILLTTSNAFIVLTYEEHGPMVTLQWVHASGVGATPQWIGSSKPRNPDDAGYAIHAESAHGDWFNDPRYRPRRTIPRRIVPGSARRLREALESYSHAR